jgi:hypothetical protein
MPTILGDDNNFRDAWQSITNLKVIAKQSGR